jgi:hypothetical protein
LVTPPVRHGSLCDVVIEPTPLVADEAIWRGHVRDFNVHHHQHAVESSQPFLGIGLYELCSPAAVTALLQQEPFEIDVDVFVWFVPRNGWPNHSAVLCLLYLIIMVMRIIMISILLNLLPLQLIRMTMFMWGVIIILCMWLMIRMFYAIVILLSLFMMILKVIMREKNMVVEVFMLLKHLSIC